MHLNVGKSNYSHYKGPDIFTITPVRIWAFVLSLAVHAWLVYVVTAEGGKPGWTVPDASFPARALPVKLINSDSTVSMSASVQSENRNYGVKSQRSFSEQGPAASAVANSRFAVLTPLQPYYFQVDELTEKPIVLRDISPVLTLGLQGATSQSVVMRLLINELGEVDEVVIEEVNLALPVQQLMKEAFSKIRFESGKIDNIPVKSQLKIEVTLEAFDDS